ncbi:kinesin-domain-containing protein [Sistotremastrum suecicum HHB10207 ss-3]|uniref:Kinesin-like protein n=1 Tax=Sistotremastrum suecicum HHB10207 ss-3 TaxID=1314776 RepID=A0A166IHW5_9AGAM|nr:kinesin-domain-containing protein [Sistotremastrum suecicum HHB10207 ss-3]
MATPRPAPFTPKRPLSTVSQETPSMSRFPSQIRAQTPLQANPPAKKIKASVTSESRTRTTAKLKPAPAPGSPKKTGIGSRPPTPGKPDSRPGTPRTPTRSTVDSASFNPDFDPEEGLVDFQNVDVDLSGEFDEDTIPVANYGSEDKVLVSIRVRPSEQSSAWSIDNVHKVLKLKEQHAKTSASAAHEFRFDEVLTGSENKPVYNATAKSHVHAAMDGYNAVIFAYGQTASGKTFTLTGDETQPGIIPRAMKDVFTHIRRTPTREYLLRCSYLEIYNEQIHDLLSASGQPVQLQGIGDNVIISPLREEVVTSLKGVRAVMERGEGNRRTASTDWNERSSRSHSVFRLVIESRDRGSSDRDASPVRPPTPGGPLLHAKEGRSVTTSVLSLIDLAGSEKATSDKDRTREGKYINTSLLTLGTVIGTLAENATKSSKSKADHVPFRNSKLTRMLQPSLSGNARISVICTLNPDSSAIAESTSTLLFAQRVKRVQLNALKKEVVDTDALIERYRKEIEDLKRRLAEREKDGPVLNRRLSAREQIDESRAKNDMSSRIHQLSKLILTSQTVDEDKGDESRPASPSKLNFDYTPYQLQQELLASKRLVETQANQILSLEAALASRPLLPVDASESEKDKLIEEQKCTIDDLQRAIDGFEAHLGEPLRQTREDVEKEWSQRLDEEKRLREEKEHWANELVRELEKEKRNRRKLEQENKALADFVSNADSLGLSRQSSSLQTRIPMANRSNNILQDSRKRSLSLGTVMENSPLKISNKIKDEPSLLEQTPEEAWEEVADISFGHEKSWASRDQGEQVDKENMPIVA